MCGRVVSERSVCLSRESGSAYLHSKRDLEAQKHDRFHAISVCFTLTMTSKSTVVFNRAFLWLSHKRLTVYEDTTPFDVNASNDLAPVGDTAGLLKAMHLK